MNGMLLLVGAIAYFAIAYIVYGRFLKKRFKVDDTVPCPSHTRNDGIDYVPTNPMVLFGHHFASIAGAGPIVGPVLAALCGWLPAVLWILLGCVFIGAMHDFGAMFISIRNQGRSVGYVIERILGITGRQLFLLFCLLTMTLGVAVFILQVAHCFLVSPSVATSSILFIFIAPFFGVCIQRKILNLAEATLVFVPILFCLVEVGTWIPLDLVRLMGIRASSARIIWILVLLYYAAIASIIPVWFLLQPRDYLNSYLLYGMMVLGILSIIFARPAFMLPAVHVKSNFVPNVLPMLFVIVACGACSGIHALVSSGTSSKQVDRESHVLPISYGGMLVEGVLAIIAIISVACLNMDQVQALLCGPNKVSPTLAFAKGLASFSTSIGMDENMAFNYINLAISAFMLTSMDTGARLGRFMWQELLLPSGDSEQTGQSNETAPAQGSRIPRWRVWLSNRYVATFLVVMFCGYMALGGDVIKIWPVFGSSNQLLAALTLLTITVWLMRKRYRYLFALLPMLFMFVISIWALVWLLVQNWGNWSLVGVGVLRLGLVFVLIILVIKRLCSKSLLSEPDGLPSGGE